MDRIRRIRLWILVTIWICISGAPARAAEVYGFGSLSTNVSDPNLVSIETEYEHPELLDVRKIVELSSEDIEGTGTKLLDYLGQAQFGRLRVRSLSGRLVFSVPQLSTGVDILMEFGDQFTPQGVASSAAKSLRLDVELDGVMERPDSDFGNSTNARFGITMLDLDFVAFACLVTVEFSWFGDVRSATNESGCQGNSETPRFVPLPGEEPRFTPSPTGGWRFRARGFADVPLDGTGLEGLQLGDPFQLRVGAAAFSGCSSEPCRTFTDFYEVSVSNARIVDVDGDPVAGASFDADSGWEYGAPPDPLPAPEPGLEAMQAAAVGLLGVLAWRSVTRGCGCASRRRPAALSSFARDPRRRRPSSR